MVLFIHENRIYARIGPITYVEDNGEEIPCFLYIDTLNSEVKVMRKDLFLKKFKRIPSNLKEAVEVIVDESKKNGN